MATQYTPILQLALPVTGELNGTWGDVVNDNITSMVEQAIAGLATINTWTANSHTLTTANGTTDEARCAMLVAQTGAGGTALTGAGNIVCPDRTKLYVVKNASSYAVTLKTSAGTGVAVAAGDTAFLFCDGTNVGSCVTQIVNGHITGNLTVDGNTTLGDASGDTVTINAGTTTFVNANPTLSQGTSTRILFLNGSKVIADAAGLTWDGTTMSATRVATSQVNITGQGDLRLEDTTGGEYVALQAPGTLAASYTLTMPADDGTNGQALITDGSGNLSWSTAASGDVYGPASSTDNAVARFDLTTGKIIQNSGVIIDDSNNVTGVAALTASGAVTLSGGTANGVAYLNGSKQLVGDADFTFDGTTLSATNITSSGSVTLSGGTANGVAYLNGSKVLTTGSALTFDGSIIDTNVSGSTALRLTSSTAQAYISLTSATAGSAPFIGFNNGTGALGSIAAISGGGLSFASVNTERMRIDSSGNLLVGTTSNFGGRLNVQTAGTHPLYMQGSGACQINLNDGTQNANWGLGVGGAGITGIASPSTYPLVMYTNGAERMRIDSSGNLLVGTTSAGTNGAGFRLYRPTAGQTGADFVVAGSSATAMLVFVNDNGNVGTITTSGSTTAFNTSSDYRLKEAVAPMTGALAKVQALKPVTYKWKADGSDGEGFIAHELQAVVPDCVTGEKDAVDAEGKPVYQGIDTSFLVATLTKAIQEQQEQINQLKAEVAALKGN